MIYLENGEHMIIEKIIQNLIPSNILDNGKGMRKPDTFCDSTKLKNWKRWKPEEPITHLYF